MKLPDWVRVGARRFALSTLCLLAFGVIVMIVKLLVATVPEWVTACLLVLASIACWAWGTAYRDQFPPDPPDDGVYY